MNTEVVFTTINFGDALLRLIVALALGMLMGYEREKHGRPAGLRTHGLVSLGSALFAMLSIGMSCGRADPSRIAASIVTGIGFLGAGTIMRHGSVVHGLTTAASVWTSAAIGMACGFGWYPVAIAAAIMVVFTLAVLRPAALRLRPEDPVVTVLVSAVEGGAVLSQIADRVQRLGARLVRVHLEPSEGEGIQQIIIALHRPKHVSPEALAATIASIDEVTDARIVEADEG